VPGEDFFARFTVDSRPEVATYAAGSVWADTNGNTFFDPNNLDYTNRDIVYNYGFTSDDLFVGNFVTGSRRNRRRIRQARRLRTRPRWRLPLAGRHDNDGVPNDLDVSEHRCNSTAFP
jgi:hypothetical protein